MNLVLLYILPILIGWTLDLLLGDPAYLPHPVVWFGKAIAFLEKRLNKGGHRVLKGCLTALALIATTILIFFAIDYFAVKLHIIRTNSLGRIKIIGIPKCEIHITSISSDRFNTSSIYGR